MDQTRDDRPHRQRTQEDCVFDIHTHGTITDRGGCAALKAVRPSIGGVRNTIVSLSRASAARLRRFLARAKGPDGWVCFGITLTVPGPAVQATEWYRVWNAFRNRVYRVKDVVLLWRIELQVRKQPHVHCVCWAKKSEIADDLRIHWLESLGVLGPCDYTPPLPVPEPGGEGLQPTGPQARTVMHRAFWPGAYLHAVKIDGLGKDDDMAWWRYLAAHASKAKQAQLGWQGRQWGCINRHLLDQEEPVRLKLPASQAVKVFRCLKRLVRGRFVSGHGRQTWFVRPQTMRRLLDWAKGEYRGMNLIRSVRSGKRRRKGRRQMS